MSNMYDYTTYNRKIRVILLRDLKRAMEGDDSKSADDSEANVSDEHESPEEERRDEKGKERKNDRTEVNTSSKTDCLTKFKTLGSMAELDFDFPFTPYSIQTSLMRNIYKTMQDQKMGIYESPTGTGKSLSVLCSTLKWLSDHNSQQMHELKLQYDTMELSKSKLSSDSTNWLENQSKMLEITQNMQKLQLYMDSLISYKNKLKKLLKSEKPRRNIVPLQSTEIFENDDHEDDDDNLANLDENIQEDDDNEDGDESATKYHPIQVIISSRTHSQLIQLISELKKTNYTNTRTVSMASRQIYCVNPQVNKLKNGTLINDKCLELSSREKITQQNAQGKSLKRQKKSCGCPYNKKEAVESLRTTSLLTIHDIEDLIKEGKKRKACPYYASRMAAPDAQILLVPYNTLLHKPTRVANGIKLKGNVIIIDEAHNLLEALAQMHTHEVSLLHLKLVHTQLEHYEKKYSLRFSSANSYNLNKMIFLIKKLLLLLEAKNLNKYVFEVSEFVLQAGIDKFDLKSLTKYCRNVKLSRKIEMFSNRYPEPSKLSTQVKSGNCNLQQFLSSIKKKKANSGEVQTGTTANQASKVLPGHGNFLLMVLNFIDTFIENEGAGVIILSKNTDPAQHKLKFLLLNPAAVFKDLVKDARSVIIIGGTLKPLEEFRKRLFVNAGVGHDRINTFTCNHIIPQENILTNIVTTGYMKQTLNFNFENRNDMVENLQQIFEEITKIVVGGIVVFFPSYQYEQWVWEKLKPHKFQKPVLREKTQGSSEILKKYADIIKKPQSKGAMLFSVVAGSLSEGINFSDDLARCVIVVGMPYSNSKSIELQQKMKYLDKSERLGEGKKFYESLCMRAVNQCIGRAIRHRNDYACILLLDTRYNRTYIKNSLPDWIQKSLRVSDIHDSLGAIKQFFSSRQ